MKSVSDENRDRAALYALGALSENEVHEFERDLIENGVLATEVEAFSSVVAELGYLAPPQQPPASLRSRVLDRVAISVCLSRKR